MLTSACLGLVLIGLYTQMGIGDQRIALEADLRTVGKYEKFEFLIDLDTSYSNPFDPDELDLSIEIKAPNGQKIAIPAFYYQHYEQLNDF